MPDWLKKEAEIELTVFDDYISSKVLMNPKANLRILDLGCGACRIFKAIDDTKLYHKTAADIFDEKSLPKEFKSWLKDNKIGYHRIGVRDNKLTITSLGKFDIISCLGLDSLLSRDMANVYIATCRNMLTDDGLLIWQANRKDTLKGLQLCIQDKELKYNIKQFKFYRGYKEVKHTQISRIYLYTQ